MENFKFDASDSLFLLIDVQERLCKVMPNFEQYCKKVEIAIESVALLDVPIVITEQYPKGLGHTVESILNKLPDNSDNIEKISFSCWGSSEFSANMISKSKKTLVLAGMETHVCVQQTALDALDKGYNVILLADCVISQSDYDKSTAIELMKKAGVVVTTFQGLIFSWLKTAKHPAFKAISRLITR